ncbi:hypothetical protein [Streptomyces paromomycinus]|uniref:Uncharacterized protein n=1 Tax=Streptomyces paromomycinus TaxID=92743 RepID=A0A401W6Q0_STREY|nr:hypothetical protein [Streptomyces paromomycinus]GCD45027.1 hypothetical protein GKJPGBOP_04747 [Streptomyces paromomycinus]
MSKNRWPTLDPDSGVEEVVPLILEWLGEQGIDALIRIDAERVREHRPAWTFFASGGPLSLEHSVQVAGRTAGECVGRALHHLRRAGVAVPV